MDSDTCSPFTSFILQFGGLVVIHKNDFICSPVLFNFFLPILCFLSTHPPFSLFYSGIRLFYIIIYFKIWQGYTQPLTLTHTHRGGTQDLSCYLKASFKRKIWWVTPTWHTNSCNGPVKHAPCLDYLCQHKVDIALIQESCLKNSPAHHFSNIIIELLSNRQ